MKISILASGSKGNAAVISHEGQSIMIDAGISRKAAFAAMRRFHTHPEELAAILVTHEHGDHCSAAASTSLFLRIPLISTQATFDAVCMWNADIGCWAVPPDSTFDVGPFTIERIPIQHDASDPSGYVIQANGTRLGWFMDLGTIDEPVIAALATCEVAVVDANFDVDVLSVGPYDTALKHRLLGPRGHLSNSQIAGWLRDHRPPLRHLVCGHLGPWNAPPLVRGEIACVMPSLAVDVVEQNGSFQFEV